MEHTAAADAWGAGAVVGHVRSGQTCLQRARRILCRGCTSDISRTLYFYAISDSRHRRRSVDGSERVLLFAFSRAGTTVALGLLGICCHLRVECVDEKLNWAGVSARCDLLIPASHR